MLGMQPSFKPKFLRHYLDGHAQLSSAVNAYHQDVTAGAFPNCEEVYR
jgi:3-methyl-2-oxobutanoate hydroxymethyltransferase